MHNYNYKGFRIVYSPQRHAYEVCKFSATLGRTHVYAIRPTFHECMDCIDGILEDMEEEKNGRTESN